MEQVQDVVDTFRVWFERSADGMLVLSGGVVVDCNRAALEMLGYEDKAEIISRRLSGFSPEQQPDGRLSVEKEHALVIEARERGNVCFEWVYQSREGEPFWAEVLLTAGEGDRLYASWRDITEWKRIKDTLQNRLALERLIIDASSRFINLETDEIERGIQCALQEVGEFVGADRSYVFMYTEDGQRMNNLYEWCAVGIEPQIGRMQEIPIDALAWSNHKLMHREILNIFNVDDLPPEAEAEKEEFTLQGIRSIVVVPMESRGLVVGFVGFDAVRDERHWPTEVVDLLKIATGIIANVLERKRAELKLRQTNAMLERRVAERTHELERRRRIAEGLREGLAVLNSNRPLQELLDFIVTQAKDLLDTSAGALYLLDGKEEMLSVGAAQGLDEAYTALKIPVDGAITGRAVAKGKPVSVPDLAQAHDLLAQYLRDPKMPPGWIPALDRLVEHYNALLAVPVMTKDRIYGAITLYYDRAQRFSDDAIRLAVAFASQAALVIENAQLRKQIEETAATAERNRLARELHDAVTQTLFSASLIAGVLPDLWEQDPEAGKQRLAQVAQLTRGALAEMRTLLLELRPAGLVEVKLDVLLQQLANAVEGRANVEVELSLQGQCQMPPDVQIAFYRIAQEALNNIVKHAGAQHVFLSLRCLDDKISMQILDDGCGFELDEIESGHLGVHIMEERAASINATCVISSQPNEGTEITVFWTAF